MYYQHENIVMKRHRMSVVLRVVLVAAVVFAAVMAWNYDRLIYPTPESESVFLKNYSPQETIKRFQLDGASSYGQDSSAGAGRDHVTRTGEFDFQFVSRTNLFTPLQQALIDDASKQLTANGARIMVRGFDLQGRYYFYYKLGKSIGSIKILSVAADPGYVHRNMPLAPGLLDTQARIEQKEVWYPKQPQFDPITFLASNQN